MKSIMEITHIGHASFRLRGKDGAVMTDPYDSSMVGLSYPKLSATIVTISHNHDDHNKANLIEGNPLIISGPGEYESGGIKVYGISTFHDGEKGTKRGQNTVYRIEIDGISVIHLGDLGHKLIDSQVDSLDGVDVLLVPVGGEFTLDAKDAAEVVSQLEPKIIIPMHYNKKELNQKFFAALSGVDAFLKEMGKTGITSQPKLSLTKEKLPVEPTVVVLE
ncbi:MBL fold metallo-hydrolase [Candidatus Gottesmanbacteria bacterium]|nr:MBL fold metallo-hydrolase [Candidatus Gottesmanbacteria bacterium]